MAVHLFLGALKVILEFVAAVTIALPARCSVLSAGSYEPGQVDVGVGPCQALRPVTEPGVQVEVDVCVGALEVLLDVIPRRFDAFGVVLAALLCMLPVESFMSFENLEVTPSIVVGRDHLAQIRVAPGAPWEILCWDERSAGPRHIGWDLDDFEAGRIGPLCR